MIVHISAEAEDDLDAIGDFIAQDNPSRALSFVLELRATCLGLAELPERFPLVAGYEVQGIRRRVHGNYLIFYRIEPEKLVVLHVLHGARDYMPIIFPS
jgi:plasmid stabilization system protein ParE